MVNENDLRVVKTKESLVDAYLKLIIENTSDQVLNICKKANKTSMTFYHHFSNKFDLTKYVVNQQLQHILPIPEKLKPSGYKQYFIYLIKNISCFFINNKEVLFNSIKQIKNKKYKNSYLDVLKTTIEYYANNEANKFGGNKLMIKWFVGGLLNVLFSSIEQNNSLSINDILDSIKAFATLMQKNI